MDEAETKASYRVTGFYRLASAVVLVDGDPPWIEYTFLPVYQPSIPDDGRHGKPQVVYVDNHHAHKSMKIGGRYSITIEQQAPPWLGDQEKAAESGESNGAAEQRASYMLVTAQAVRGLALELRRDREERTRARSVESNRQARRGFLARLLGRSRGAR